MFAIMLWSTNLCYHFRFISTWIWYQQAIRVPISYFLWWPEYLLRLSVIHQHLSISLNVIWSKADFTMFPWCVFMCIIHSLTASNSWCYQHSTNENDRKCWFSMWFDLIWLERYHENAILLKQTNNANKSPTSLRLWCLN